MVVTVSLNLTELYDFDSTTGVTCSQGSAGLDSDFKVEGIGSLAAELRSIGVQWMKYTRPSGSWDLQNTHIYIAINCIFASLLTNKANGGLRILVGDGTNVGYWYCEGSDTYNGGFIYLVADTSQAIDSGSCNLSAVTEIGIGLNLASGAKNVETTWVDIARFGDGITVTSDALCNLDDILAEAQNNVNASGIIRKSGGVFSLQGKLRLGSISAGDIYFQDPSKIIVFEDKKVASDLYEIVIQGNPGGTTSVVFGEKVGGRGISGYIFKSAGTPKFGFTATDPDIDTLGLYGCTFLDGDTVSLPAYNTNKEMLSCNLEECNKALVDTCIVEYCSYINPDSIGAEIDNITFNLKNGNFINAQYGVEISVAGTYTFDNMIFSGCTTDIHNTSGGLVTVNCINGSNPGSYTGNTIINNAVSVTITVKNSSGTIIEGARVFLEAASGGDLPFEESVSIVRSDTTATVTHTDHGLKTDDRVSIEGTDQPEYDGVHQITVTGVGTYTYTVSGSPATPATGTPTSTYVIIEELTNASGIATETLNYSGDQPFTGWVRKSDSSPFYRNSNISGSITSSGFMATMVLTLDE